MRRYWKCKECYGTGKVIRTGKTFYCADCDGTGNAYIDGATERHKREIAEIENRDGEARWS